MFQPDWVKMDRHVLQFNGYFRETVVESRLETHRLRKLVIYFYLEDDSIAMISPKQENSEIPQGQFLSRQKVAFLAVSSKCLTVFC